MYSVREQCLKKRGRYASQVEAEKRLDGFVGKGFYQPGEMLSYHCPNCGMWHLGHDPKRRERERNEFLNTMSAFNVKKI